MAITVGIAKLLYNSNFTMVYRWYIELANVVYRPIYNIL